MVIRRPGQPAADPSNVNTAGVRIGRTTNVSSSSPTVIANAIWRNVDSGMIATMANVAARMRPATVIAADDRGTATVSASASGR